MVVGDANSIWCSKTVLRLASHPLLVEKAVECLTQMIGGMPWNPGEYDFIKLALIESFVNAAIHGNGQALDKRVTVLIGTTQQKQLIIEVTDEGDGYVPREVSQSEEEDELALLSESGRGLMLIRAAMDEVTFSQNGRCIRMCKKIPPDPGPRPR